MRHGRNKKRRAGRIGRTKLKVRDENNDLIGSILFGGGSQLCPHIFPAS